MLEIQLEPLKIRSVIFLPRKMLAQWLVLLLFFLLIAGRLVAAPTGPTLRLDYGRGTPLANPVSKFMYFVPLISPEPVTVFTNDGNTQCARVLSFHYRTNGATFAATCEFEFTGQGCQQNIFDHTQLIARRIKYLQAGESLPRQLAAINVTGAGQGSVEIQGGLTHGLLTVNEVRLRFNGHGQTSPVTINLQDLGYRDGTVQFENEIVARVNSLSFRRTAGRPKMEVLLASVKSKAAGEGVWQNFIGELKGAAANMFLPPLTVEPEGQQAMLDFGLVLATKKTAFTFPPAARLEKIAGSPP